MGELLNYLVIRPARPQDVPQIIRLIGDVWAEYGCVLDTSIEEKYLLTPDEYFHARNGEFCVVETKERLVATVAVMMLDVQTAELKSLYVETRGRGTGLGERLTRMAIKHALDQGAAAMVLWTDTRFTHAHRLYERIGFTRTGIRHLDDINHTTEYGYEMAVV